jgi:acetylglutamate kinase
VTSRGIALGPREKAAVLIESLPYIRRFWGKIVVVKYGGNVLRVNPGAGVGLDHDGRAGDIVERMISDTHTDTDASTHTHTDTDASTHTDTVDDAVALASFAEDVVLMRSVGMLPVVVHGGGPQIGALMERVGKQVEFRDGLRVTDAETIDLVRMVLVGQVNRNIVSAINVHGPLAVGLSGEDANLITATFRDASLGYVGDVEDVHPVIVQQLLAQGLIPVVATIGSDKSGQAFNINADTAAGALAAALDAEKLVFLTDVSGLRTVADDPSTLVQRSSVDEVERLIENGGATGGMIPKLEACVRAVRAGVNRAHILDGRALHAVLLEIFTDEGIGTMIGLEG